MGNYWILSAGKDGELWPAFWTEHRIAIGWPALGDLREYNNYEALREAMARHHPGESVSTLGQWAGAVWRFYRDLQKDELVFIRSYTSLLGIAIVSSDYDYIEEGNPLREKFYSPFFKGYYPHVRAVRWLSLGGGLKQQGTFNRLTVMERPFRDDEQAELRAIE